MKNNTSSISDFPDWLSPMLIKELRQGMRTRLFAITFITLQVLMIGFLGISMLLESQNIPSGLMSFFFWFAISLPVLFALPFSGFQAVSNEIKGQTLELIQLTRLNAWRIVWGKWMAIVAQIVLLLCAVLPYVILRYFLGGINLADDLKGLASMLLVSATLTAAMVGFSSFGNRLFRILIVIGLFLGIQILPSFILGFAIAGGGSPVAPDIFSSIIIAILSCLFISILMLKIGAGRIAPASENHTTSKRLLGIFALLAALTAILLSLNLKWVGLFALLGCVPVFLGALIEENSVFKNIYRPFAKRGMPGRLLGRIFYPGWSAGIIYIAVMLLGFLLYFLLATNFKEPKIAWMLFVAVLGCFTVPAVIIRFFSLWGDAGGFVFFVFHAIGLVLGTMAINLKDLPSLVGFAALHPLSDLLLIATLPDKTDRIDALIIPMFLVVSTSILILAFYLIPALRRISQLEKQSLQVDNELA
ncbi:MAG: ABC transporter permease [Chthoniobacterales bacterium]